MIEDVVTTGGSLLQSIRHAEEEGYLVTHALTLIDRDEGGREAVEAAGYKFWALFRVERNGDEVSSSTTVGSGGYCLASMRESGPGPGEDATIRGHQLVTFQGGGYDETVGWVAMNIWQKTCPGAIHH